MQVNTFLWFDGRAEEAAELYTRVIAGSEILEIRRGADGRATVTFELAGQRCIAYDGGPQFGFGAGISLYVECDTQDEVDAVWTGLTADGQEGPGGSLTDRFGVTWQVVPKAVGELLDGAGPDAAERVLTALHAMTKIDIQGLVDARAR
ncbi:VOC family protein [Nocardia sp. BMG51109]|uniref:VOC family protein n=1 Tax=Nocardia sp. BMG51109 TaxID=1056816 RepID=UPI000463BFA6|nr:VOC family protein [Nocardia sp. BMG51109]